MLRILTARDTRRPFDLTGTWYAIWETTVHQQTNINREVLVARSRYSGLALRNLSPSLENQVGGYLWRGSLKLRHDRFLVGRYEAVERNSLYRGTLFYVLHPSGQFMCGRWVGCSYDADLASGLTVMARSAAMAEERFIPLRAASSVRADDAFSQSLSLGEE